MAPEELDAIRHRARAYRFAVPGAATIAAAMSCAEDVPSLLAEAERLRTENERLKKRVKLSDTHWKLLTTSAHLWGWGALWPDEKALNGTPCKVSPRDCDRIVDAAIGKVRELQEMWADEGRYHHCDVCGEGGPLKYEGSTYTCAHCAQSCMPVPAPDTQEAG